MTYTLSPYQVYPYAQYGGYAASRLYPYVMQQPQVQQQQAEIPTDDSHDSLSGTLMVGTPMVLGFTGAKYAFSPVRSFQAAKAAQAAYTAAGLNTIGTGALTATEKATAFSNLLNANRMMTKVAPELQPALEGAYKNYQAALQTGNTANAAKYAAEMETIISKGKAPGWFGKYILRRTPASDAKAVEITTAATNAGNAAAAAAANTAQAAEGLTKWGQVKNWTTSALKSGGFKGMAIIEGLLEGFTNVLPAFQISTAAGLKQTVKSGVSVAGSATGWCLGAKAGAAIGATIGSVIPGIGTGIGGAIGMAVGGLSASWLGRKIAGWFTGKSEVEKHQEKQQEQQAAIANMQRANFLLNGGYDLNTIC